MDDRLYLVKVLSLSAVPRILSSSLKFFSYPIMVLMMGPKEYGIIIYLGAFIIILESFADFGVSSAAGKEIANIRDVNNRVLLNKCIKSWARLQFLVAIIGLLPLLISVYFIVLLFNSENVNLDVLIVLALASWFNIATNFSRANLTSMLSFKSLAVLDSFESIIRSLGWLSVAYILPTSVGLGIATLVTAIFTSLFAILILHRNTKNELGEFTTLGLNDNSPNHRLNYRYMLNESLSFLWLRLITRLFYSTPIVLLENYIGIKVLGLVGAFTNMVEMLTFPFSVIGNALAVRAPEIVKNGEIACKSLWDTTAKIILVSLLITLSSEILSDSISLYLFPDVHDSSIILAILSLSILTSVLAKMVAPMSDYVGALKTRNVLLTIFTFVQLPVIWCCYNLFGNLGALIAFVIIPFIMSLGYLKIALSFFFKGTKYRLRSEVLYGLIAISVGYALIELFNIILISLHFETFLSNLFDVLLLWAFSLFLIYLFKPSRKYFLSKELFYFIIN